MVITLSGNPPGLSDYVRYGKSMQAPQRLHFPICCRDACQEEVTREHAEDVVELMRSTLWDQFSDGHGGFDTGRSGGRSGKRAEAK
eukprot:5689268-Pyramimonas_sp.AAC.1